MEKEPLFIAFASQKGGVGKTAFTVLTAGILHYRRGYNIAVVDCDSPQHSIGLMRDRDMECVKENDSLKVALYRQHEQFKKMAYPIIKSDPEHAVEDFYHYARERDMVFDIVLFDLPGTLRSIGCGLHAPYLHSAQSGQCRDAELPAVRHCNPGGTDCPRELSSQRRPSLLEHDRQTGAQGCLRGMEQGHTGIGPASDDNARSGHEALQQGTELHAGQHFPFHPVPTG